MSFYQLLLEESGRRCCTSTTLDVEYAQGRFEHEGVSFLTITLARFGKDFLKALDRGQVDLTMFATFSRHRGTPRFLGGFLDLVFDRSTGRLLDEPSKTAILAIRQLTLMFAKIKLDCSNERSAAALQKFIECDREVGDSDQRRSSSLELLFGAVHRLLGRDLWSFVDNKIYDGSILPKHGPGSTAEGILGNKKFLSRDWTMRLEHAGFHYVDFACASWSQHADLHRVTFREPGSEMPARVTSVPKTLETPRIIAMEPVCMQFVQQGLLEVIVEGIQRDDILKDFIRFDGAGSQEINQRLARHGSSTGELATLDLSEASDRVSNRLVRIMHARHVLTDEAVQACRSTKAEIRELGITIELNKFASMGSALCFPMEAMVFLTTVFVGISTMLNRRLTRKDIESYRGKVRIYGDDIIVPAETVPYVTAALEAFGFVVNSGKSFWTGRFRESCGKDYYDGTDVSIVRMRSVFPTSRKNASELVSTVSLRNQLYEAGYEQPVAYLDTVIERLIPFPYVNEMRWIHEWEKHLNSFLTVTPTSPVLGRLRPAGYQTDRMCPRLQRPLVRGAVIRGRLPINEIDGYDALLKHFLKRGDQPVFDEKHLERSGRPRRVFIDVEWSPSV